MEYVRVRYSLEERSRYSGVVSMPKYQYEAVKGGPDSAIGETLSSYIERCNDYLDSTCDDVDEFELVEE